MPNYYKPKRISEIDFRNDAHVAVIGKVTSIGSKSLTLDDGKSKAEVSVSFEKLKEEVQQEKFYRIFCSIVEKKLRADVVQNLNSFDLNLFNKTEELYRKSGV